jgi:hypothetical protein
MTYLKLFPRVGILAASAFLISTTTARAADRLLDFSGGCKIYKLENRAWVETDAASHEGAALMNSQILKDEKFTVFRTAAGTFGVNQKCVKAGDGSVPAPVQQRRARTAAKTKRVAAAKPTGPSYFDKRKNEWSAAFGLGMNLSPSGTIKIVQNGVESTTNASFSGSIAFMGEAHYRMDKYFRLAGLLGITQLKSSAGSGNETSFFAVRPEIPFRVSNDIEVYLGPMLGLYFLSQNAETTGTLVIKQQTASAILLGGILGADYAISDQFDLGLFLLYSKPGELKITGTDSSDSSEFASTLTTSYMTIGTRFVIHF